MAKFTEDDARAIRLLAREFNLDHHGNFMLQRCFIVGIGRVFLKDMKRHVADDPDVVELNGRLYWINGVDGANGGRVNERHKAEQWVRYYVRRYERELRHVVDWLDIAVRENHVWLENVDDVGRPRKLMKCGSVEALHDEATKQFRRIRAASRHRRREVAETVPWTEVLATHALTSDDLRWVCDLGHGLRLVQLLTPEALDDEGERMGHCIGYGNYDHSLNVPDVAFYSVRDTDEVSVATLEVDRTIVKQFVGPANSRPREDVAVAVSNLMARVGWMHWIEVYEQDIVAYSEFHRLRRLLAMPYHVGVMDWYRLLPEEAKAAEIARLRAAAGLGSDDPVPEPPTPQFTAMDGQEDVVYTQIVFDEHGEPHEVVVDPMNFMRP